MKKYSIIFLLLFLLLLPLAAEGEANGTDIKKDTTQTVRLSVTTSNTVYLGVAENEVNSSILPKTISSTTFLYNPRTMNWETKNFYLFVISFVQDKLTITLTPPGPLKTTSGDKALEWKNESSFPYSLSSSTSSTPLEIVSEDDKTDTGSPRVYSWEMKLVVDGSNKVSREEYNGTFKLEVKVAT